MIKLLGLGLACGAEEIVGWARAELVGLRGSQHWDRLGRM